jgi:NAD(P)-dependent dehydrogenase (short-subunit alcohol dehydrogenase family)
MVENLERIPAVLNDALILVTGAGQGNGRAIAVGVASAGARVVVTDVRQDSAQSTVDEILASGGKAKAWQLDVTDAEACTKIAEQVASEIGAVNVLVNNAGIIIRESIDSPKAPENWRRVMDVNVNDFQRGSRVAAVAASDTWQELRKACHNRSPLLRAIRLNAVPLRSPITAIAICEMRAIVAIGPVPSIRKPTSRGHCMASR